MKRFHEEVVSIPAPHGRLEGVFSYLPDRRREEAALLLSPHPVFGGDLDNNVIAAVAEMLAGAGYPVLRFNYHGVGKSDGPGRTPLENLQYWTDSLHARGHEAAGEDAAAALRWLLRIAPSVHAFGYSFGALVGLLLAARSPSVRSVVAAATVVECYSLEGIAEVDVPVLAVHGEGDFATATTATREVLAKLRGPVGLVVSKGADHFFRDREAEVARLTLGFFENPLEWLAHLRAAGHTLSGARRPSVPTTRRSP